MICGHPLQYLEIGQLLTCNHCSKEETGYVYCADGHYICDDCHGASLYSRICEMILLEQGTDPLAMAENVLAKVAIPMLGCEHAWVTTGVFLAAIRNEGSIHISTEQIIDALNRTRRQSIGAYCGLTGICGIAPAIGASFSIILGAACPKDHETSLTMRVVSQVIAAMSSQVGPCCCKNLMRHALSLACQLAKEHLQVNLTNTTDIICRDIHRHPHGCRGHRCSFYR